MFSSLCNTIVWLLHYASMMILLVMVVDRIMFILVLCTMLLSFACYNFRVKLSKVQVDIIGFDLRKLPTRLNLIRIKIMVLLTDASGTLVKKLKVEIKDMIYIEKNNISTFKK